MGTSKEIPAVLMNLEAVTEEQMSAVNVYHNLIISELRHKRKLVDHQVAIISGLHTKIKELERQGMALELKAQLQRNEIEKIGIRAAEAESSIVELEGKLDELKPVIEKITRREITEDGPREELEELDSNGLNRKERIEAYESQKAMIEAAYSQGGAPACRGGKGKVLIVDANDEEVDDDRSCWTKPGEEQDTSEWASSRRQDAMIEQGFRIGREKDAALKREKAAEEDDGNSPSVPRVTPEGIEFVDRDDEEDVYKDPITGDLYYRALNACVTTER